MTLALRNEIDTSRAAAGDQVTANVSPDILDARLNRKIKPADGSQYWTGSLISHTSFPVEGTLVFRAPHGDVVIPRGFSSGWTTVGLHGH
jgi:hypothetical protein